MAVIGISSTAVESTTHLGGMSCSLGSSVFSSCVAAADAVKIPRSEVHSDSRMEYMVLAAPTSMVPTAIGRTTLNQTVLAATAGSLVPMRRGRSGSKNNSSGIRIHQAMMPPETLMDESSGPMM